MGWHIVSPSRTVVQRVAVERISISITCPIRNPEVVHFGVTDKLICFGTIMETKEERDSHVFIGYSSVN